MRPSLHPGYPSFAYFKVNCLENLNAFAMSFLNCSIMLTKGLIHFISKDFRSSWGEFISMNRKKLGLDVSNQTS